MRASSSCTKARSRSTSALSSSISERRPAFSISSRRIFSASGVMSSVRADTSSCSSSSTRACSSPMVRCARPCSLAETPAVRGLGVW